MTILYLKTLKKNRKRRGRGNASGLGGEAGRGHKGQKSRSGYSRRAGFEGGQTPLYRRLPKLNGFSNSQFKVHYDLITLDQLNSIKYDDIITIQTLIDFGLVSGNNKVKLVNNGTLSKSISLSIHAITQSAKKVLEKTNSVLTLLD